MNETKDCLFERERERKERLVKFFLSSNLRCPRWKTRAESNQNFPSIFHSRKIDLFFELAPKFLSNASTYFKNPLKRRKKRNVPFPLTSRCCCCKPIATDPTRVRFLFTLERFRNVFTFEIIQMWN